MYAPDGFQPGGPLTLWGMVRPGANGDVQRVQIEFRSGSGDWVALPDQVLTDGRGYFSVTLPKAQAGQYRFQWVRPEPTATGGPGDDGPVATASAALAPSG
jgi:hypothetical protein